MSCGDGFWTCALYDPIYLDPPPQPSGTFNMADFCATHGNCPHHRCSQEGEPSTGCEEGWHMYADQCFKVPEATTSDGAHAECAAVGATVAETTDRHMRVALAKFAEEHLFDEMRCPVPALYYNFDNLDADGTPEDCINDIPMTLYNGAAVVNGSLQLGASSGGLVPYGRAQLTDSLILSGYGGEMTLSSWVKLAGYATGGSPLSLTDMETGEFDAIVWAESEADTWMAGSDYHNRYQSVSPGYVDTTTFTSAFHHVVITYGTEICMYLNGLPYGTCYAPASPGAKVWSPSIDNAVIVGPRHFHDNSPVGIFQGEIDDVAIFSIKLSAEQVVQVYHAQLQTKHQCVKPGCTFGDANCVFPVDMSSASSTATM
jgi:hypothetical protein